MREQNDLEIFVHLLGQGLCRGEAWSPLVGLVSVGVAGVHSEKTEGDLSLCEACLVSDVFVEVALCFIKSIQHFLHVRYHQCRAVKTQVSDTENRSSFLINNMRVDINFGRNVVILFIVTLESKSLIFLVS